MKPELIKQAMSELADRFAPKESAGESVLREALLYIHHLENAETALRNVIDKNFVLDEYEGEEREGHITAHVNMAINSVRDNKK